MLDLKKDRYIILELIPTASTKENGEIIQLSALKLEGLQLVDRFDYRLKEDKVPIQELLPIISYDPDSFHYVESTQELLDSFSNWSEDLPLLIMDNGYTENYLADLTNEKKAIFPYLSMEFSDDVIRLMIEKYHLVESNYVVDLLYEALIQEISN
ncbi:MAG TPA: hypothetical protein IAB56_05505 [Candidatus Scybalousia intestinigallinarum]|nr:hypothetical protein [Candidatus Scybalousia intestinigallinarum]